MKTHVLAVVATLAAVAAGCGASSSSTSVTVGGPGHVSKAALRKAWPFTVSSGTIGCDDAGGVTFTPDADGAIYAVNGTAIGEHKYHKIEAIWKKNRAIPGTRIDISPIIDKGLKLCS